MFISDLPLIIKKQIILLLLMTGVELKRCVCETNKGWRGVFNDAGDQFTKDDDGTSIIGIVFMIAGLSLLFTNCRNINCYKYINYEILIPTMKVTNIK